jgi:hypothetical protein
MNENEAQQKARNSNKQQDEMGPTEKLREQDQSEADTLVPGTRVPGAQNPESEIKDEKNPNTE